MTKFLEALRAYFTPCQHNWAFIKMSRMNELGDEGDEILSSKEYSLQRCGTCGKEKYRKL